MEPVAFTPYTVLDVKEGLSEAPPFAEAVYSAMLTHCNQYVSGFRRGALHGRLRRVGRRMARESADLRGGRHVSRTAALSAVDPTESYAPGKSHEISRCTPCPASVPRENDTKCYARGARVPHASTEKPHSPGPIALTDTRRRRIIRYYAAATRCATAWKLWPSVASLEHRTGAEHPRRA